MGVAGNNLRTFHPYFFLPNLKNCSSIPHLFSSITDFYIADIALFSNLWGNDQRVHPLIVTRIAVVYWEVESFPRWLPGSTCPSSPRFLVTDSTPKVSAKGSWLLDVAFKATWLIWVPPADWQRVVLRNFYWKSTALEKCVFLLAWSCRDRYFTMLRSYLCRCHSQYGARIAFCKRLGLHS